MTAGDGLDREAVRRHYESTRKSAGPWYPVAQQVPALLDALEAAEARLAESVPRSALVQVGWKCGDQFRPRQHGEGIVCSCQPVYVLRTEGGAS